MFRILSLDGGGIKGAFTASVIATLEEDSGRPAAEHFDLITGTSTGGIIAVGLGLGIPAREILKFYLKKRASIFPGTSLVQRTGGLLRQLCMPKHSHADLRNALVDVFSERKFGESKCRLVIPTYDAIAGRIFVMKTAHHERFKYDIEAAAVDVALATSAAPTYFAAAPFPAHKDASYVDRGVWANAPVMGEFSLDDARPEKIQRLISLGRGEAVKKENLDIVKTRFLNGTPAPTFTPMHSLAR